MKKTSFVCAILASALLAGACGGKKSQPAAPTGGSGDMAPAGGSGSGSDMAPPAGGSGSGSSG
jgi:hypothetical protein